jgi:hypothetical protein
MINIKAKKDFRTAVREVIGEGFIFRIMNNFQFGEQFYQFDFPDRFHIMIKIEEHTNYDMLMWEVAHIRKKYLEEKGAA